MRTAKAAYEQFSREQITPVGLGESDSADILIQWADGEDMHYDFRGLRLACPCAMCIDENTGEKILEPAMVPVDVSAISIESVGQYAMKFTWSDGHSTGIYPFPLLRLIGQARRETLAKLQGKS